MSRLFRFPTAAPRDPEVDAWLRKHPGELGAVARHWFTVIRNCGADVRELLHDGHPTACVGEAAYAYVNVFKSHVNVGFFRGAALPDPSGLMEGTGRFMRHVKVRPGNSVDPVYLHNLIAVAYKDMKSCLNAQAGHGASPPFRQENFMSSLEAHYSAPDIEARILAGLRAAGLNPDQRLSPEELAPLDHFHTGGLRASRELLEVAGIRAGDCVLDIGAGLGGSARLIAASADCRVDCVELSVDYCAGARLLNRLTGLADRIAVHEGSALDLPFPDHSFDVVWIQNVGMNIADKRRLYGEIARVLKPGGRYAFQEMIAGDSPASYFPLPWATDPTDNFLISADEMRSLLDECGFVAELLEDTSDLHLSRTAANATPAAAGQLGLAVFVDNLARKAANARRSLEERRVRLVRGVFRLGTDRRSAR